MIHFKKEQIILEVGFNYAVQKFIIFINKFEFICEL